MESEYQDFVNSSTVEKAVFGGLSLLVDQIETWIPIGMLHEDGMEHGIGNVEQLFVAGGNEQGYMAGRVSGRRDRMNAGDNFCFSVKEVDVTL